jgi:hypothetical protein
MIDYLGLVTDFAISQPKDSLGPNFGCPLTEKARQPLTAPFAHAKSSKN